MLGRMLTERQRAEFDDLGFVSLPGAFGIDDAAAMRAVAWRELGRKYGIRENDSATWTVERPSGLKNTKRHRSFDAIGSEALTAAFDELMGAGEWARPRTWGQVMVTFPNASQAWVVPHGLWHVDFRYDASTMGPLFGLKVFAFFGDVAPRSGGTLASPGRTALSHDSSTVSLRVPAPTSVPRGCGSWTTSHGCEPSPPPSTTLNARPGSWTETGTSTASRSESLNLQALPATL